VKILNRKSLEEAACECDGVIQHFNGGLGLKLLWPKSLSQFTWLPCAPAEQSLGRRRPDAGLTLCQELLTLNLCSLPEAPLSRWRVS
jgi:hypothetical protein